MSRIVGFYLSVLVAVLAVGCGKDATPASGTGADAGAAADAGADAGCPPLSANSRLVPNGTVYAIAEVGCTHYIGGNFTAIGPNTGGGAPLNTSTGQLAVATPLTVNGFVQVAVPDDAGGWFIGGTFTKVGTTTRNRLARLNADGTLQSWDPNANSIVNALAVSGSTVYAGGAFTTLDGGTPRNRLAAIGTDGTVQSWDPNANSIVNALAVSGTTVYAGGSFTTLGGQQYPYFAPIDVVTGVLK
ncbi:MAG: delta-60 repeat domain-containing protein [Deltaproteobacteria bacterium]|nr:delta-60 repeat domain-containing protein [Deltaproteobacteria bacterium]